MRTESEICGLGQEQFEGKPHGWIQWKGTNVCIDLHCQCGAHMHFDGGFMYTLRCPHCNQRYWARPYIALEPLAEGEFAGGEDKVPDRDEDIEEPV